MRSIPQGSCSSTGSFWPPRAQGGGPKVLTRGSAYTLTTPDILIYPIQGPLWKQYHQT